MRNANADDQPGFFDAPVSLANLHNVFRFGTAFRFGTVFRGTGWFRTILVYCAAVVFFLLFGSFEGSWSRHNAQFEMVAIERVHPFIWWLIGWSAFVIAVAMLVVSAVSFRRGWLRWPVIGLLIAFVVCPCCFFHHVLINLAHWTVHGQIQTEAGNKYVFCDSSFLQGQMMAIAEVGDVGTFTTSYRVLVYNNGDSPRSWASLIRPDKSSDEYGQLYLNNGLLIGVRYNNRCFLAFDLQNQEDYGHDKVETLSPFVCLEAGATPSEIDVARTCEHIQGYAVFLATPQNVGSARAFLEGQTFPGCPPGAAIRATLASDSPPIAAAAKRLLSSYDEARARILSRLPELEREFEEVVNESDQQESE